MEKFQKPVLKAILILIFPILANKKTYVFDQ